MNRKNELFSGYKMNFMTLITLTIFGLSGADVRAADLTGAKDHPLLKRFANSEIVGYEFKRFDEFELQTSHFKRYNLETKQREFVNPPLKLEGAHTLLWYESAGDTSTTELIRNYQNELRSEGFQILYDSKQHPAATTWVNFLAPFADNTIKTNRSYYIFFAADPNSIRVVSAKWERSQGNVYVNLIAVEWPKDDAIYKAKHGAYVSIDIIEEKPMTQNMVLINADEMSKSIASNGRVALYGIFFDTNKADIKLESKASLEEISKLLKKESNLKLHVVGHTDNVGGYEFNLNLSKRRADAVVTALTQKYGIAPNRLTAHGIAYLAPMDVNTTEEGRTKNRRVELVPW